MLAKLKASTKTTYLIALLVMVNHFLGLKFESAFIWLKMANALLLIFFLYLEFKNYLPKQEKTFFRYFLHGLKLLLLGYLIGWVSVFLITTLSELSEFHLLNTMLMLMPLAIADVILAFPFLLVGLVVLSAIFYNKEDGNHGDILDSSEVNN